MLAQISNRPPGWVARFLQSNFGSSSPKIASNSGSVARSLLPKAMDRPTSPRPFKSRDIDRLPLKTKSSLVSKDSPFKLLGIGFHLPAFRRFSCYYPCLPSLREAYTFQRPLRRPVSLAFLSTLPALSSSRSFDWRALSMTTSETSHEIIGNLFSSTLFPLT
jgi:hypothetical protein